MITVDQSSQALSFQQSVWLAANHLQLPVAVWRLPQTDTIHLIVDLSGKTLKTSLELEDLSPGFALSPFLNPSAENCFYISAHLHYTFTGEQCEEQLMTVPKELYRSQELFNELIKNYQAKGKDKLLFTGAPVEDNNAFSGIDEKEKFERLVSKAIKEIERGSFQKVVLSRSKKIKLTRKPDLLTVFHQLVGHYPNAFVSMVSVPGLGTWMGASPEILVSVDKNQLFRTVALAGTQPLQPEIMPSQASWTQKEIEEQALVSRYIINCFKHIRLREFDEDGPKTVVAGNLMHLRTDFQVDMKEVGFPQLGTVMLKLLHPTSAVCGMPKDETLKFILAEEGYERALYSGFLGPVNIAGESHLYVNLRCTQWRGDEAILYAGAGVTANSVPEKEWKETELKCLTMLRVITKADL